MRQLSTGGYSFVTAINESVLPEAVDFTSEIIAGLELLTGVEDELGIEPNIVICPGYSQLASVMSKMIAVAEKLNGFAFVDIARHDNVQEILTARATGAYASSSPALVLCAPHIVRYNANEEENQILGLSVALAVAKAATDSVNGFWISPSNFEISSILGTDIPIRSSLTDTTADTNLLNGAGIVTLLRRAGTGYRVWGNWTAAFPTEKGAEVMIAPRAVRMMIREVLIDAAITYLDRNNITKLTIEMIQNNVNAFLRDLIGKGAINSGSCLWKAEDNPSEQIATGMLQYSIAITYGPSLDTLVFVEVVENNYNNTAND